MSHNHSERIENLEKFMFFTFGLICWIAESGK